MGTRAAASRSHSIFSPTRVRAGGPARWSTAEANRIPASLAGHRSVPWSSSDDAKQLVQSAMEELRSRA